MTRLHFFGNICGRATASGISADTLRMRLDRASPKVLFTPEPGIAALYPTNYLAKDVRIAFSPSLSRGKALLGQRELSPWEVQQIEAPDSFVAAIKVLCARTCQLIWRDQLAQEKMWARYITQSDSSYIASIEQAEKTLTEKFETLMGSFHSAGVKAYWIPVQMVGISMTVDQCDGLNRFVTNNFPLIAENPSSTVNIADLVEVKDFNNLFDNPYAEKSLVDVDHDSDGRGEQFASQAEYYGYVDAPALVPLYLPDSNADESTKREFIRYAFDTAVVRSMVMRLAYSAPAIDFQRRVECLDVDDFSAEENPWSGSRTEVTDLPDGHDDGLEDDEGAVALGGIERARLNPAHPREARIRQRF